jgi:archaemetzincin
MLAPVFLGMVLAAAAPVPLSKDPTPAEDQARAERLGAVIEKLRPSAAKLGKPKPGDWLERFKEPGQTFKQYLACDPTRPTGKRRVIYVQPLGEFTAAQRKIVKLTADFLAVYFNVPVKVQEDLPAKLVPEKARRKHPEWGMEQMLTTYILDKVLKPRLPEDAAAYICFTATDLWPGEGWNFVFGQASLEERVGVWSIRRFGDPDKSAADFRLALLRAMKLGSHETGHMFSLLHCTAYECNMCGCNNQEESDRHPLALCPECLAKVCWATRADPAVRYRQLAGFCKEQGLAPEEEAYRKLLAAIEPPGGAEAWKQGDVVELVGRIWSSKAFGGGKFYIDAGDDRRANLKGSQAIDKLPAGTRIWVKGAVERVRHEAPPDYEGAVELPQTFLYLNVAEFKVLEEPKP